MIQPDTSPTICTDPQILNQWHPISAIDEMTPGEVYNTLLLSEPISYLRSADGRCEVSHGRGEARPSSIGLSTPAELPTLLRYGYLWTSLGDPPENLFSIPHFDDPLRRNMNAGSLMVATSAPRVVENFLDLAHFPYVHGGTLGELPHTEVTDYDVEIVDGELIATKCDFFVPLAAAGSGGPALTRYWYRVPHPYCVLLYHESPRHADHEDVIGVFVQPMTEDRVRAHNYLGVMNSSESDTDIKRHQLLIFGQDRPILENQQPKLLPLDPNAAIPIRADKSSIAYRRWLSDLGITYGVIAATSHSRS